MSANGEGKDPFESFLFGSKGEDLSADEEKISNMDYAEVLQHVEELLHSLGKLEPLISQFSPIIMKYFSEK